MFPHSNHLLKRASLTDAWAATKGSIRENDIANSIYPQYVSQAKGAYLWDMDGNKYLDFILGYGPVILGHADGRVHESYIRQLSKGVCMSPLWSPCQFELTELLSQVIPGAEGVFLMRTGSDATSAAVRLARIFTGRNRILRWGYNGWHDWTAPRPSGVPEQVAALTETFRYNDLNSVEAAFAKHVGEIACVIMMPYELESPSGAFLEGVKNLAHRNGALFILDEMRSGFRIGMGGAQEFFNVTADLATFSKAMANGFAISAVTGRKDILAGLGKTHMSSTFFANAAEMAAAITTINILQTDQTLNRVWSLSDRFYEGLHCIVRTRKLPAKVQGLPISPFIDFENTENDAWINYKRRFYEYTISKHILLHPNHQWYLSASHTEQDIDHALDVCDSAFEYAFTH